MIIYKIGYYVPSEPFSLCYIHKNDLELDGMTRRDIYFDRDGELTHLFLDHDGNNYFDRLQN